MQPLTTRAAGVLCAALAACTVLAAAPGRAAGPPLTDAQARALAERVAETGRARSDPWIMLAAADILAARRDRASAAAFDSAVDDARRFAVWDAGAVNAAIARLRRVHADRPATSSR